MGNNIRFTTEVLIVGAGPSGSALAALLAEQGRDVLLLDRAQFPRDKTCGDGLTPRAIPVLQRLGVLSRLEAGHYQRIEGAQLIPAMDEPWTLRFGDYDLGLPSYGLVVPRYELDYILLQHAMAKGARFISGFNAAAPLRDTGNLGEISVSGVTGDLNGRSATVDATLTVLAVGANIGLLRAFGLIDRMPPGMNAVRGYFTGVTDLGPYFEFYFERELVPGYAWVFPLADGRANIGLGIFGRNGNGANRATRRLLEEFMQRSPRLRGATPVGPPKGFPLRIDFPRYRPTGDGYLLVGEALGLVNPVTGEGIDLALESAALAATAIGTAFAQGRVTAQALSSYSNALNARYRSFFNGVRLLPHLAMRPSAIRILARQGKKKPRLARLIAGINMGLASPWQAFSPLTWWDILT